MTVESARAWPPPACTASPPAQKTADLGGSRRKRGVGSRPAGVVGCTRVLSDRVPGLTGTQVRAATSAVPECLTNWKITPGIVGCTTVYRRRLALPGPVDTWCPGFQLREHLEISPAASSAEKVYRSPNSPLLQLIRARSLALGCHYCQLAFSGAALGILRVVSWA